MEVTLPSSFQKVHRTCINNLVLKGNLFFRYIPLKKGEVYRLKTDIGLYYLFFSLENKEVKLRKKGKTYLSPNTVFCEVGGGDDFEVEAVEDTVLILHAFNDITNICDREFLCDPIKMGKGNPLIRINDALDKFLDLLEVYLLHDTCCYQVNKLKHQELFMIFRRFYNEGEYYALFNPIINDDQAFRKAVKDNYMKAKNMNELAAYCNKSLSTFIRLFKKQFHDNPHNWIKKQKLQLIIDRLSDKEVELSDIVEEFNFSSFSYFSQYCKLHLGKTPKDFRKQILK